VSRRHPPNRLGDERYLYTVFGASCGTSLGQGVLGKQFGGIVRGCGGIVRSEHATCVNGFDTLRLNTVVICCELV
jgi:hypothetical protein